VAALALFLLAFCVAAAVAVAQDSTVVADPVPSTMVLIGLALPVVSFVVMAGLKWLSPRLAALPVLPQRGVVLLISAVLTALGTAADVPLPTTVDTLTQSDVTTLLTWLVTILYGGGGAMATHAGKNIITKEQ